LAQFSSFSVLLARLSLLTASTEGRAVGLIPTQVQAVHRRRGIQAARHILHGRHRVTHRARHTLHRRHRATVAVRVARRPRGAAAVRAAVAVPAIGEKEIRKSFFIFKAVTSTRRRL
jgi:hypothetical protein